MVMIPTYSAEVTERIPSMISTEPIRLNLKSGSV